MANKIVTINRNNLIIHADTEEYFFRYRIVSEDKNRLSAWSPVYGLPAPTIDEILLANGLLDQNNQRLLDTPTYTFDTIAGSNIFNIFWNAPSIFTENGTRGYDLYIKWGTYTPDNQTIIYDGDYEFTKRLTSLSFSFTKPSSKSSYDAVSIWVQSETYPKKIVTNQMIYSLVDQDF